MGAGALDARPIRELRASASPARNHATSRRATHVGLLVCRRADDAPVGVFNFSEIVRGAFQSAYLGYYGFAEHSGRGYMSDGLSLALRVGFRSLRLHRIEANVQPANAPSITLVRRGGFTREGYSRRYVKIAGRWRDHERWALLVGGLAGGRTRRTTRS